jgi:penicillin-binding protein 1A
LLLQDDAAGGGSTLSQQLAKNLYPRKTYSLLSLPVNKLREMFTARRLEKIYTKEELLALYLNTVPFGDGAFGIKVAAFRYFGKDPAALTLEEAATLVGMLKATTYYNPRNHPEAATERRNTVLTQMARYGNLEAQLLDSLHALPLALDYRAEGHNQGTATYFREHLRREVEEVLEQHRKPDGSSYNLYRDGLKIYTTIDSRLQRYAEAAVARQMPEVQARFHYDWRKRSPWSTATLERAVRNSRRYQQAQARRQSQEAIDAEFAEARRMTIFDWQGGAVDTLLSPLDSIKHYLTLLNAGLLSVEPGQGLVRAWVGGIDHRFIQYDHVKARRPVGSTFKPIVYTAALQSGMMPCEYTIDSLRTYPQFKNWQPQNAGGEYGGAYSLAGALSNSVNTIAVELALRAGIPQVRTLARAMGIQHPIPNEPAIALGAVDADLREMVTVYSTFANRGYRPTRLHYLDRIETASGEIIADFDRPRRSRFEKVLEPGHADMMLSILQSVVDSGTARSLRTVYGINGTLMGKTGTTQNQSDGWFLGFNSELVTGVWVGAAQPQIHFRSLYRGQASKTALPIFGDYMKRVYRDKQFRHIRYARYETPPEMVVALLDCPPHLPEMPVLWDATDAGVDEITAWSRTVEAIAPAELEALLREHPRRRNESLGNYADRIRRKYEREENRDGRRQQRKEFWEAILFGEQKQDRRNE